MEEDQVYPFQPRFHQGSQDLEGGVGLLRGEEEGEVPIAVRSRPSLGAGAEEEGGLDLGKAGEDFAKAFGALTPPVYTRSTRPRASFGFLAPMAKRAVLSSSR